jgi:hypothetical protein
MKNSFESSLYPGAHVKYAVDIFGVTFEPFSTSPPNNKVKTVTFEKEEPGNPLNTKFFMTFHLGPVSSLEEAKKISELEKDSLLDIVCFHFSLLKCLQIYLLPYSINFSFVNTFLK